MSNYRTIFKNHYHLSFDKDIQVHHIDHNRENNDIENLVALPTPLHKEYHNLISDVDWVVDLLGGIHCFFFHLDQRFWIENKKMFVMMQDIYELMQPWRRLKTQFDITMRKCEANSLPLWNNLKLSYKMENGVYLPSLSFIEKAEITQSFEIFMSEKMCII